MIKFVTFLLVCSAINIYVLSVNSEGTTLTYQFGDLGTAKGLIVESILNRDIFYSFLDIKYAKPPIGQRRFKATQIINKFEENPYDATKFRRPCISMHSIIPQNASDDEVLDCLFLSVHSSNANIILLVDLPVMVYITGFDLLQGSNQEVDPQYFMEKNVVLVTVQYRLGVFGFLNAETGSIPGNAAVHDILTALKWIQKHIHWFGGDSRSVTVFGHYKVAGLIQALTMIPEAKGLFHQAICQSGSIFTQDVYSLRTSAMASQLGITLGCPNIINPKKLADCLLEVNLNDLNSIFRQHVQTRNGNVGLLTIGGLNGLIPYSPYDLEHNDKIRPYRIIFGTVENPSTYLMDAYFNETISIFAPNRTNLIDGLGLSKADYKKFILNGITNQDKKMRKNLKSGIDINHGPTYVYIFKYHGNSHYLKRKSGNPLKDVTLLDDNIYLLPYPRSASDLDLTINRKVVKKFVTLWTSFASTGVPKTDGLTEWPQYQANMTKYLVIDSELAIEDNFQNYEPPVMQEL